MYSRKLPTPSPLKEEAVRFFNTGSPGTGDTHLSRFEKHVFSLEKLINHMGINIDASISSNRRLGRSSPISNNSTEAPAISTKGQKCCPLFVPLSNSFFMERCFI